ncbi:MAG: hypothetical protein LBI04_08505, partial [Treponema sp.]|nr:hypothetical protein [Treponema sp.]
MKVTIELRSGLDTITVEPATCVINNAVCNDSLQHVENSCETKFVYELELFSFIVSHEQMDSVVRAADGEILFTGIAGADTSWTDIGEPHPIDSFALTIKDYTAKLDVTNSSEIVFLDALLETVIRKLISDCGLVMMIGQVPAITIEAFVMPPERNYRQTLDALCYQYQLSFYFDNLGRCNFFYFGSPAETGQLGQSDMLAGVKVKKSRKRYDAVQIEYNTLTQKKNEQIFFESFGYASDNTPSPVIVQPGVYYPFDAAPEIESAEGQVYQSFVSGFAESRKKYNGELEYRRSKDTSLLYSSNHAVAEDWEGDLEINRTEFESLRSSVRFYNTGTTDAKLRQFAIRADAIYRNKAVTVTAGRGFKDRTFTSSAEFVYNSTSAENLAKSLYRYFSRASLIIEMSTDARFIRPGSYHSVDTGKSGLVVDALILSCSLNCEKEIYSYKAVSIGPAAVDILRVKSAESDTFRGDQGESGQYTDWRYAKNIDPNTAPPFSCNEDSPGSDWFDIPPV